MRATIKPIIVPGNRRKDGTWAVSMRVTFKGKSRRLPTSIFCQATDLTRTMKIKSPVILASAERIATQMRDAVAALSPFEMERHDVDWVVAEIRRTLGGSSFRLDFFRFSEEFLKGKKESTAKTYIVALNALERYLGCRELDINDLTHPMLIDFIDFLANEPKALGGKGKSMKTNYYIYLHKLSHLFTAAKIRYNDEDAGSIVIPRSPFTNLPRKPLIHHGQDSIGREAMQKVILARGQNEREDAALAVFVLSFCTMGANIIDLWKARPFKGEWWVYNRTKTAALRPDGAEMRVKIVPEMLPYIERLQAGRQWWLGRLHEMKSDAPPTAKVNYYLRGWAARNGIKDFTFYAARHTFGTLARKAGVDKATIAELMNHIGQMRVTDIYVEKDWDILADENRKVLNLFNWG